MPPLSAAAATAQLRAALDAGNEDAVSAALPTAETALSRLRYPKSHGDARIALDLCGRIGDARQHMEHAGETNQMREWVARLVKAFPSSCSPHFAAHTMIIHAQVVLALTTKYGKFKKKVG